MKIENVKKYKSRARKTVTLNIRVTPEISQWMKEKEISPTLIFYEALKELNCPHVK